VEDDVRENTFSNRQMVAAGYARKRLEAPSKQDCLGTVLILSGDK